MKKKLEISPIFFKIGFFKILIFLSYISFAQPTDNSYIDSLRHRSTTLLGHSIAAFQNHSIDGHCYSDSNLKGKITVLNFWFKNCLPCIAEVDALNNLYANFKNEKNFQFLSFTFENVDTINAFSKRYNINYPIIPMTRKLCYKLNFNSGFPTTIIVDKVGKVAFFSAGGSTDPVQAMDFTVKTVYPILGRLLKSSN